MRFFPRNLVSVRLPLHQRRPDNWSPGECRELVAHHDVLRGLRKGDGFRRERTSKHAGAHSVPITCVDRRRSVARSAGKAAWLRNLIARMKRKEVLA